MLLNKEFAAKLGEVEQPAKGGLEKLEIVLFASAFGRGGRKGGSGGIPPAEPVDEIGSDIFKYIPPKIFASLKFCVVCNL